MYVDDLILTGSCGKDIQHLKEMLKEEFKILDLGEVKYFLGIEIIKTNEGMCNTTKIYSRFIKEVWHDWMQTIKPTYEAQCEIRKDSGEKVENVQLYISLIGSLLYATITRLEISHLVGILA